MLSNLFTIPVRTIDEGELRNAALRLYMSACNGFQPDLIVGIRRGGYIVAEHMRAAAGASDITLLPISRCRPSTIRKNKSTFVTTLVKNLPGFVNDRLRAVEHALLVQKRPQVTTFVPDQAELAEIQSYVNRYPSARILVVDDAVDSGVTLAGTVDLLRMVAPSSAVRTAAIVTTSSVPLIEPDYSLYRHELCRFPWSLDFKTRRGPHL